MFGMRNRRRLRTQPRQFAVTIGEVFSHLRAREDRHLNLNNFNPLRAGGQANRLFPVAKIRLRSTILAQRRITYVYPARLVICSSAFVGQRPLGSGRS